MAAKRIHISGHARFEMKRRRIRPSEVVKTIRSPGQIVPSAKGRQIFQALIGRAKRLLLRVIVKEAGHVYHVVTAYKTSKIAKYWRPS
jgi:hypothetical protein